MSEAAQESPFVNVWSKNTGRMQRIPRHYLDNPHLMKPFRLTPPSASEEKSDRPSEAWTIADLRAHANAKSIDLTGVGRSKAALLERINAPQIATGDVIPNASDPAAQESASDTVSGD